MDSLYFVAFSYLFVERMRVLLLKKESCLSIESARVLLVIDIGSSSIRCNAFAASKSNSIATAGGVALSPEESHLAKTLLSCGVKLDYAIISGSEKPIDVDFVVNLIHQACHHCIQRVCQKVAHPDILAIGFSSLCMNIIGVDGNGRVITPFFTYAGTISTTASQDHHTERANETRNEAETRMSPCLNMSQSEPELKELTLQHHSETGTRLQHNSYAIQQLQAFRQTHDATSIASLQTLSQRLVSWWSTEQHTTSAAMSVCEASWTGLLNIHTAQWSPRAATSAGIPAQVLPELVHFNEYHKKIINFPPSFTASLDSQLDHNNHNQPSSETGGHSSAEDVTAASLLTKPIPESIHSAKIFLGVGDGACASFGSQCRCKHRIAVSVGTSAAVRVLLSQKQFDDLHHVSPALWTYRIDKEMILVGGAITDGGNTIEWFKHLVGEEGYKAAFTTVEQWVSHDFITASSNMVFPSVLPFFSGERSPGWRDTATATITGLTRSTSPAHLLYAIMESVCFALASILKELELSGCVGSGDEDGGAPVLVVSGAAMECNAVWRQMLADSTGYSVSLPPSAGGYEATSLGMAQLMLKKLQEEEKEKEKDTIQNEEIDGGVSKDNDDTRCSRGNCLCKHQALQSMSDMSSSVGHIKPRSCLADFYSERKGKYDKLYSTCESAKM